MAKALPKPIDGTLRKFSLRVPEVIRECSGIVIFGKRIKSLVFSTDVAIIRNVNADAVIAVYPFTPQPIITSPFDGGVQVMAFAPASMVFLIESSVGPPVAIMGMS